MFSLFWQVVVILLAVHRLPCEIDLRWAAWVFLNWLIYCLCMFLERESTCMLTSELKSQGVGEEKRPFSVTKHSSEPQCIKYLNNVWNRTIFSLTVGCLCGRWALWPFVSNPAEVTADARSINDCQFPSLIYLVVSCINKNNFLTSGVLDVNPSHVCPVLLWNVTSPSTQDTSSCLPVLLSLPVTLPIKRKAPKPICRRSQFARGQRQKSPLRFV